MDRWERMREELSALTLKDLRAIAKADGITLGYDASRKDTCVAAIVGARRHMEREGYMPEGHDWHTHGVTAPGGIMKGIRKAVEHE